MENLELIEQVAISAVKKAGGTLIQLLQKEIKFEKKSSHDILAEGDLLSEKIIMDEIKQTFPDHSFLSEEAGEVGHSQSVWIIDPIDGTINFSRNLSDFCISIAFVSEGELQFGLIYKPVSGDVYRARKNKGAFLNGNRIAVSKVAKIQEAMLTSDNSSKLESRKQNFEMLQKICQEVMHIRIYGSGALHLALIAEGKVDIYFKTRMNYWDYAAGILLVEEAGGKLSDFRNNSLKLDSQNILATNGIVHETFLDLLNK